MLMEKLTVEVMFGRVLAGRHCSRSDNDDICALLGYYATSYGDCLPTFRDNVSVQSSRVKSPSIAQR
jgi:hypothetical protein